MKIRSIILGIFLSFVFVSCGANKESITPSDWLNYYVLQDRSNKVTIAGRAMKGRIKEGTIKIVPLDSSGKCDRKNPKVLATTSTDEKGNYSASYERIGQPICVFVVPSENVSSKMYDEFSKTDLDWSGDSFLVSVMNEPSIQKRKQSGLSLTPLTRFAAGRLEALVGNVNPDSTNINSLVSRSNREIASRFGIRKTSLFSKITENVFSKTESTSTTTDDFPEISEVEIDFDNPNDKNAVTQKAILGGLSVIANQVRSESTVSTGNVEGVLDTFSRYVASGRNDGRDSNGNVLTIPGSDVPLGNNALSSVINSAINTYIQSGGAEEIGVSAETITSTVALQDKLPETVPNTIGDITPPEVLSFSPANDATNILPNTTISIAFNEPIDTSITSLNTQATNGTCRGTIQVSADDFKNCIGLSVNSAANPTIVLTPTSSLQGSSTYKVRVTTGLVDKAINPIALTTSRGFTTVDLTQPVVLDVTSLNANASYQSGSSINLRVTYAIPVIVTGTPRIRLNTTPIMYANYISGSGTTTLDFSYVIGTTENSPDLDYASTNALELNGATITNSNGLANAFLTLPTPGSNGSLGANRNIVIDNSFPVINFASLTSSGIESTSSPAIALNLSKSYFQSVTVNYSVTGGTATSALDFTLAAGTLTFPAGTTTQSIPLSILNDSLDELDETIIITLVTPTKSTIGTIATHTYTITDDDLAPTVSFGSTSSTNAEATTSVIIPVTLSAVSGQAVTVNYSVTGGNATDGIDFTLANGTITFPAGTTTQNITLAITNDSLYEPTETIVITLSNPTSSTLGTNVSHTYTITDDDTAPTVAFALSSSSGSEATTSSALTVSLSAASALPTTVDYSVSGGTATSGTDFTLAAATLTFPAGTTTQTINLAITNDALTEGSETVIVALANPTNSTLGVNTFHTYTIIDDDVPAVSFSATSSTNSEATTAVNIPVSLSASSTQTITVDYSVTGGTATGAGTDFTLAAGTLTFSPSVTTQNIALSITNDSLSEASENIIITLTNPTNSNLGTNVSHTYTITDEDPTPSVQFSATTSNNSEATTSVTIPVSLSTASGQAVTVGYSVTGGTATGSGTDYTLAAGTLTFPVGTTTQDISLSITNDSLHEASETVILTLATPTASTLGVNTTHTYTITDDDTAPTVQFDATTSSNPESTTSVSIPVSLSTASGQTVTINYSLSGTATGSGTDYTLAAGTLTFPAGTTTQNISIAVINDTIYESTETVILTLTTPVNSILGGNNTHTYSITNDDSMPTISFTAGATASVGEGAGNYVLNATLSTVSGLNTTVEINSANGSATSGSDYTAQVGQALNIPAGSTTGTLNIAIAEDIFYEGNETFTVTMSSPVNATISGATQTVTITDNEIAVVSATTLDCDADGKIDHYQIIFDNSVTDSSFPGYALNAIGTATSHWLVAGYTNVRLAHGSGLSCAGYGDAANDTIIYLTFTEGGSSDTGAKPDLTTTATPGLSGGFGTVGQISTASVTEADGAKPVITSITPANGSSNIAITSLVATAVFSEAMNTGTFNATNFTMTGAAGISGTVATSDSTTTTFTAPTLAYNQSHTINITNMADLNGQTMNSFSSTFSTSQKNQVTGNITNGGTGVTVTLTVNGTPTNFNGTTNFSTTNLLGIGDIYSLVITSQPPDKVCALLTDTSNSAAGTFSGTTNITININCVNGHAISGHIQQNPPAPLNFHLYQGNATTIAGQNNAGYTNGTGAAAQFNGPTSVTFDGTNFYIADQGNAVIRQVTPAGVVTTVAGNGTQGFVDATGGSAQFQTPYGITSDGTYLYVAEYQGKRIRRVRIGTWEVTTLAGDTGSAIPVAAEVDGIGTAARFSGLHDVTLSGNELFMTDREGHRVKKMNLSTKQVTTIAGNGTNGTVDNATGTAGQIAYPNNLTILGNYIYVGSEANVIRRINNNGTTYSLDTVVGQAGTSTLDDGIGTAARVSNVRGLTSDGKDIYFSDVANGKIRRYEPTTQKVTTLVGGAPNAHLDGIGIGASLAPYSVVTDGKNLFFTEGIAGNVSARFRKLTNNGLVAYYPLHNSVNDYAGNGNLTVNGSPTLTTGRFNEANGAYNFGTGNSLSNATSPTSNTSNVSLAAWVKWNGTGTGDNQVILAVGGLSNGYLLILQNANGNKLTILQQNSGWGVNCQFTLPTTHWTHVAATSHAAGQWKMYINGKHICSEALAAPIAPSGNISVGGLPASQYFSGAIADARVYTRILNEGEINELAQNAAQAQVGASYSTGATGLLVNFHLNNGSGQSSGAIPDLGLTGGSSSNTNGKDGEVDGARIFNGTSNAYSTTAPAAYGMPPGSAERTLCAWIHPSQAANNHVIVGYGNNTAGQGIGLSLYLNKYFFWTYGGTGATSTVDVMLNKWQHFCGVYHPTNGAKIFVDGIELASVSAAGFGTVNTNIVSLTIGRNNIDSNNFYAGKIDDVSIYNQALSAIQIRQLAAQIPMGLVARYDLNGDVTDVSGFGANGTVTGSITSVPDRFQRAGSAYKFSGVNYVSAPDRNLPMGNSPRTICNWYRGEEDANFYNVLWMYGSPQNALWLQKEGTTPNAVRYWGIGDINASATISKNTWNHYCLLHDGTQAKVYVNGRLLLGEARTLATASNGAQMLYFGSEIEPSRGFIGSLDDLRIYNRALSEPEIRELSGYHPMQVTTWNPTVGSSSLKLHLQADSLSNLTNDAAVTGWDDSSGNLFNVSQGNASYQPTFQTAGINNKVSVRFTRTNLNSLSRACETSMLGTNHTILGVIKETDANANNGIFQNGQYNGGGNGGKLIYFVNTLGNRQLSFFNLFSNQSTVISNVNFNPINQPVIFSVDHSGSTGTVFKNGANDTNASSTGGTYTCGTGDLSIGRYWFGATQADGGYFDGNMGDMLYFDQVLTSQNRQIVECYLSSKYNIPLAPGVNCP